MGFKNSTIKYGSVAKWMHWLTALCFLVAYCSVHYRQNFTELGTPDSRAVMRYHFMFGISAGFIFFPRFIWRALNIKPRPEPMPQWQHSFSKASHWLLYFCMLSMPLTGWMGNNGASINYFWVIDIPTFRSTKMFLWLVEGRLGLTFEEWEAPIDYFHKYVMGRWLAWMLITGHIFAALYHHFVKNDNTLKKIMPSCK